MIFPSPSCPRRRPFKADQIIVWVGITEGDQAEFHPAGPLFPAILDTGNTHNFAIREEHLIRWVGLDPRYLDKKREVRIDGDRLALSEADVWLKPNEPGQRAFSAERAPFRLDVDGIAVYPNDMPRALRLPLVGLRALRRANLHRTIDGRRCLVTLGTTPRYWFF